MRQLITLLFFSASALGYASGCGPMFLGMPLLGSIFAVWGLVFEFTAAPSITRPVQE